MRTFHRWWAWLGAAVSGVVLGVVVPAAAWAAEHPALADGAAELARRRRGGGGGFIGACCCLVVVIVIVVAVVVILQRQKKRS